MTQRWDAARSASQRPLRKYKPCGPVGVPHRNVTEASRAFAKIDPRLSKDLILTDGYGGQYFPDGTMVAGEHPSCHGCGYHVCRCWKSGPKLGHLDTIAPPPRTMATRMSILEGLDELGMLDGANRQEAINLLLTGEMAPPPVSGCHRSFITDREYHTRDCGERPCALEVKP